MLGKGLLVMIAAFGISFTFYSSTRYRSMMDVRGQVADYQYEALARDAAETGFSRARLAMLNGISATVMSAELPDGGYRSVVSSAGARVRIESQGRQNDTRSMPVVWKIYAEYERLPKGDESSVPPFMEYALIAQGDLELAGSPSVTLYAGGSSSNANVHTNSSLTIKGGSVDVAGFGTYVEGVSANPESALETSFTPAQNEMGRNGVHQVSEITIPEFDASDYMASSEIDQISSGDLVLSGDYNFGGTRENPYVWYVDGDLAATGGATIDGYVVFLVDGNIEVTGNLQAGQSNLDSGESTMAFYSSGSIEFNGTIDIYGQFFADGDFIVEGTPSVYGTVTTGGTAKLIGTPNLHFVEASPVLTEIWTDDNPMMFKLLSYFEARDRLPEDKLDLYFVNDAN